MDSFVNCLPEELQVLFFKLLTVKRPEEFEKTAERLEAFDRVADKLVDIMRM